MNFFWHFLVKKEKYFFLKKSNLKTPSTSILIFNKYEAQYMLLKAKLQQFCFIDFSCYQHPSTHVIPFYILFDYHTSQYVNFFLCFTQKFSSSSIYPSLYWLEREVLEFFNYPILNLKDSRNLLLDYNKNYNALLKYFPTSGFEEVYYDPFFDKVLFKKINMIEL